MYNINFHIGFATSLSTLADLTAQTTEILSDDGSVMDVRVTTGDTAPMGHFSLLTDYRIDINRVLLVDTVTDDDGDESESVTNVMYPADTPAAITYQGGRPFYLYHGAEGPALSIGANSSKVFRIKYRSYQVQREFAIPDTLITAVQGTAAAPKLMAVNTLTIYDETTFTVQLGEDIFDEQYGRAPNEYLSLPDNADVGDRIIIINAVSFMPARETRVARFYFTPETHAGKIVGLSVFGDERDGVSGSHITLIYVGGNTGWIYTAIR